MFSIAECAPANYADSMNTLFNAISDNHMRDKHCFLDE